MRYDSAFDRRIDLQPTDAERDPQREDPRCSYCGHEHDEHWNRTPQGRPACRECGAIPADHQRDHDRPEVAGASA